MAWTDLDSDRLLEPKLVMNDFLRAIQSIRPSVTPSDIARHIAFTKESGID